MDPEIQSRLEAVEAGVKKVTDHLFPEPKVPTPEEVEAQAKLDEAKKLRDEESAKKSKAETEFKVAFDRQIKDILIELLKSLGENAETVVDGVGEFPQPAKLDDFVVKTIPRILKKAKEVKFKPIHGQFVAKYLLEILETLNSHYQRTEDYQFRTMFTYKLGKGYDEMTFEDVDVVLKEWAESIQNKTKEELKAEGVPEVKTAQTETTEPQA